MELQLTFAPNYIKQINLLYDKFRPLEEEFEYEAAFDFTFFIELSAQNELSLSLERTENSIVQVTNHYDEEMDCKSELTYLACDPIALEDYRNNMVANLWSEDLQPEDCILITLIAARVRQVELSLDEIGMNAYSLLREIYQGKKTFIPKEEFESEWRDEWEKEKDLAIEVLSLMEVK